MRHCIGWVLLSLGLSACTSSMPLGSRQAQPEAPVEVKTLANGLELVTQADSRGVTAIDLTIHAGSAHEQPGEGGLAHLVEHVVCSAQTGTQEWIEALTALGAVHANATTALDETKYFSIVPSDKVDQALALYQQVLENPVSRIDDSTLARENQIVRQELQMRDDWSIPMAAWAELLHMLYPADYAYGRVAFAPNDDATFTREQVQTFVARHYLPQNSTLALVGGLPSKATLDTWGALPGATTTKFKRPAKPRGASSAHSWDPKLPPGPTVKQLHLPVDQSTLWFGWRVPKGPGRISKGPQVLAYLGNERLQPPHYIDEHIAGIGRASMWSHEGNEGMLVLGSLELAEDVQPERALRWVNLQLRHAVFESFGLVKGGLAYDVDQIGATAGLAHAHWLSANQHPLMRAALLGQIAHQGLNPKEVFEELTQTSDVQPSAIKELVSAWVTPERVRAVHVVGGGVRQMQNEAATSAHARRADIAATLVSEHQLANNAKPPRTSQVESGRLPNGLSYAFFDWPNAQTPVVVLGHDRGAADAPTPEIGFATECSLARHTWLELGERGIDLGRNWNADSSFMAAQSPIVDVATLASVVLQREREETPIWPGYLRAPHELPTAISPHYHRTRMTLLRDHPWAQNVTSYATDDVTLEQVNEQYVRAFDAKSALLVVVGDLSEVGVKAKILQRAAEVAPLSTAGDEGELVVSAPLMWTPLSAVTFEELSLNAEHASFLCLLPNTSTDAVNRVTASAAKRALTSSLREERAVSYYVGGGIRSFRSEPVMLVLDVDMSYDHIVEALSGWRDFRAQEARTVLAPQISGARFSLAHDTTTLGLTTASIATALFDAWRTARPFDSIEKLPQELAAVTEQSVFDAFDFCRQHSVLTFYGNATRLRETWTSIQAPGGSVVAN